MDKDAFSGCASVLQSNVVVLRCPGHSHTNAVGQERLAATAVARRACAKLPPDHNEGELKCRMVDHRAQNRARGCFERSAPLGTGGCLRRRRRTQIFVAASVHSLREAHRRTMAHDVADGLLSRFDPRTPCLRAPLTRWLTAPNIKPPHSAGYPPSAIVSILPDVLLDKRNLQRCQQNSAKEGGGTRGLGTRRSGFGAEGRGEFRV